MAFMHLSSIEVYQHHDEHTQTNAHKDVRVPNAHSAPPCSIHNRIWKSRPRVVLYVASSKSKVFGFWIFFVINPKGSSKVKGIESIYNKKHTKKRLQTKNRRSLTSKCSKTDGKRSLDKKVSRKRFLSL